MPLLAQAHRLGVVHQQDAQQLISVIHLLLNTLNHRRGVSGDVFDIAGDREVIE
ncbi:hypothetical protein D3C79_857590 [compost metagenome]